MVLARLPSGYEALDRKLADASWPAKGLCELLVRARRHRRATLSCAGIRRRTRRQAGRALFFDPPGELDAAVLGSFGIDLANLIIVKTRTRVAVRCDSFWALEQDAQEWPRRRLGREGDEPCPCQTRRP